jgi:hypothetical protein
MLKKKSLKEFYSAFVDSDQSGIHREKFEKKKP